ncbi:85ad0488-f184-4e6b-8703-312142ff95d7 [Sclerotinia trifoliorum]|uniref:85ad0488-f184-4e6b-8703-312142ff95d7 n=1 Tax=Sclerotinia trifoliorum TaxID=28548 RepID=A0A8H2VLX4_9HELO|nr:85ad0488-f184-4e6b-8703-312142ff95d7 [Sclerotinia trifoliorum]
MKSTCSTCQHMFCFRFLTVAKLKTSSFTALFQSNSNSFYQVESRFLPVPIRAISSVTPLEPTGLIAKEGIELLTFWTPNGYKISILLEELKYTAINPNGRVPAIVDHDRSDFAVWESSAILAYLTRHYDLSHHFFFPIESDDYSRCEQWIAFHHAGLGPMQGQANHFYRLAKERMPYPTQRYISECERLYGVLDRFLADRNYLVGPGRGKYSIADIANFTQVNAAYFQY